MLRCYLDVDGVLVPTGAGTGGFDDFEMRGWGVPCSPRMLTAVEALAVQRVWVTTWGEEANSALCPLFGWDESPTLLRRRSLGWWKLDAVLRVHTDGTPFIWCDDELEERDARDHVRVCLDVLGVPYLLVCPQPHSGLRPADLEEIAAFVERHASATHGR